LEDPSCLNDGRLSLPFSKIRSLGAVRIYAGKLLTIFVKNRNLPVLMLASLILPQLGALSFFQCFYLRAYYLNWKTAAQVPIPVILFEQMQSAEKSAS
jgi:hypothetical protein